MKDKWRGMKLNQTSDGIVVERGDDLPEIPIDVEIEPEQEVPDPICETPLILIPSWPMWEMN
jgi:hypothetical protein